MKAIKIFGTAIIALAFSSGTFAQLTAYTNIYAEIVSPAVIEKSADLTFSRAGISGQTGSVVLGSMQENDISGQSAILASNGTLAAFSVAANDLSTFDVTLPAGDITLGNSSSKALRIGDFTKTTSAAMISGTNSHIIRVGATLRMEDKQLAGNFADRSSFLVTFNYN